MTTRRLAAVLLAGVALAGPVAGQQFIKLPLGSWANDITPDGEVVVGTYAGGGFIWRWRVDPSPTVVPGGDMVGVSDDGTVVAGNIPNLVVGGTQAAIWTAGGGWQGLGWLGTCDAFSSSAYDISGDGTTVVGLAWAGCSGRGFRWTAATGMQELQNLANGNNRCSTISGDGSALGGFAQGSFTRTPAYWAADTSGFVLDPTFEGEVYGFNENGSKSVGTKYFSGGTYSAFLRDAQTGVITNLGKLTSTWGGNATDLSEDNSVIVGYDVQGLSRRAWVWTAADGIVSLNSRLSALGITGAPNLLVCRAVSDDGNAVVGGAEDGGGPFGFAGFIAEFSTDRPQWTDLGNGLAGTHGVPSLVGAGPLTIGSATSVVLANAKRGGPAAFVVGFTAAMLPFKQGILVPFPDLLLVIPALGPSGSAGFQFAWPAGVPSGFSAYWQCLVGDAAGPAGFAISNALQSTTP
jgi:uncharacterized membrane protein